MAVMTFVKVLMVMVMVISGFVLFLESSVITVMVFNISKLEYPHRLRSGKTTVCRAAEISL